MSRTKLKFENKVENNYTRVEMYIHNDFFVDNPSFNKEEWITGKGFDATTREKQDELVKWMSENHMGTYLDNPFGPAFVVYNHKDKILLEEYRISEKNEKTKERVANLITDGEIKKRMTHNSEFKDKLENILNEE